MYSREFLRFRAFILNNLGEDNSLTINEYIVGRMPNFEHMWFVRKGCDLIVDKVTLDDAVRVLRKETR